MNRHFDNGLHVRTLIETYRPKFLLELGAAQGANTVQLLSLRDQFPFKMITISNAPVASTFSEVRLANTASEADYAWVEGISYEIIPQLPDRIVEFVSIDTDHNYECLKKELDALYPKLFGFCILVFHDTASSEYNDKMIGKDGRKMNQAIAEFMLQHREFVTIRESHEYAGAWAIGRGIDLGYLD